MVKAITTRTRRRPAGCLALLMTMAVVACAAGGGGGISGSGLVFGPITDTDPESIVVNGVRFDTAAADVTIDGVLMSDDDLRRGMVVTVNGPISSSGTDGIATSVEFRKSLEGRIESVDALPQLVVAVGQTLQISAATVFDGTALAELLADNVILVSGIRDAQGTIFATRVELRLDTDDVEVRGAVTNLDAPAQTFVIGGLIVDFGSAVVSGGSQISNGDRVHVTATTPPSGGTLIANEVEVEGAVAGPAEGTELEISGFITGVTTGTEFVVNGSTTVITTPATEFEDGSAADLVQNARVEVEGTADVLGRLVADEIEFDPDFSPASTTTLTTSTTSTSTTSSTVVGASSTTTTVSSTTTSTIP